MGIETKSNIGDEVYFMKNNLIQYGIISEIQLYVYKDKSISYNCKVDYIHRNGGNYSEYYSPTYLYDSRDELIKTL